MKIEHMINSLNKIIEEERVKKGITDVTAHLVLHKSIILDNRFPAYKNFEFKIWYVGKNIECIALSVSHKVRAVTDDENEEAVFTCEKQLFTRLLKWVRSPYYDQVVNGVYEG